MDSSPVTRLHSFPRSGVVGRARSWVPGRRYTAKAPALASYPSVFTSRSALFREAAPPGLALAGILLAATAPAGRAVASQAASTGQVIRSRVDLVTSDLIVRDRNGVFVPDLRKEEIQVYEDGVRHELATFTVSRGGRVYSLSSVLPPAAREGLVLPPPRPPGDAAGRIFLLFVDDYHLDARNTPRIRELIRRISRELVHEGDMFGVVSTGHSAIEIDLTYDRRRLDHAIAKISGGGLRPQEILDAPQTSQGAAELRHRAHVAFSTARQILGRLEQVHDRRKAFVYVSNGYDFDPFPATRARQEAERNPGPDSSARANDPATRTGNQFGFADLASELSGVIRAANRANASLYTIDPRGLVAGADLDEKVDMVEWNNHVRTTQDTLRVLADETGGFAMVNSNDFTRGLRRIDAETSDYYVIGYYSTNADPLQRRRTIRIDVSRPGVEVKHRTEYYLKPVAAAPK